MDMTDRAVELYYRAARRDAWEVLRWRAVKVPAGRKELLLWLVLLPLVAPALVVAQHGRAVDPASLAVAGGVGLALGAVCLWLERWRTARRMYRWASEHREYRLVVTGLGIQNHRPDGTAVAYRWDKYKGWAETRGLFVLVFINGDLGWVPKRDAQEPDDLDRIRSLFDRNLTRWG
ncbi:YcxB family protein [Streptomyces sp. NPDC031705]|uniref:YcxB family protein n=1 Tax=Streptomyces sp. NPDC031705 TaxID=3155729 RepID=UPI0033FBDC1A